MASLTIRNLTSTPLELKSVERFEGRPVAGITDNATINAFASAVTGFLNGTAQPVGGGVGVTPQGDHPISRDEVSVHVAPFETKSTDIRAADPGGREVLRLTFEAPPGSGHRYTADCPAPSPRSFVMRRGDGANQDLTAVYVANGGFLAVLSSTGLADWMGELRDELPLSALSVPGTHNSPTCHKALPSVRCQAVGVREQLDNGVRFLDIRVSIDADGGPDLALVHSAFPISLTGNKYFRDMIDRDVLPFLEAHPRETVVISLKREGTGKGNDQQLSRAVKDHYVGPQAHRWFVEPRIPRLGEARGKIVLVRRFALDDSLHGEHGGAGWALDAQHWPDNCADGTVGSGLIRVQDFYEVTETTNIEKKIELARAHLERAAEVVLHRGQQGFVAANSDAPPPFFVNFLSASNFFNANCWPDRIAARVNPAVIEYLCMRHGEPGKGPGNLGVGDAGTGVVVTDWVGNDGDWDLIRCIVAMNAKLHMKSQA